VVLLVPEDDPLIAKYKKRMPLVTGSKENVLSRYLKAQKKYDCDYMVRITGDCFFLPNHVVSRHIKSAIYMQQPYTTNTVLRTYPEGYDVEVVSREAMNWLEEHATSDYDREHVTTALKSDFPNNLPFKICYILEKNYDLSAVKTSIDTQEEYYTALKIYDRLEKIKTIAHKTGCVG
jgi:spore coat polysaccharide biosynthesis protein SpsF